MHVRSLISHTEGCNKNSSGASKQATNTVALAGFDQEIEPGLIFWRSSVSSSREDIAEYVLYIVLYMEEDEAKGRVRGKSNNNNDNNNDDDDEEKEFLVARCGATIYVLSAHASSSRRFAYPRSARASYRAIFTFRAALSRFSIKPERESNARRPVARERG